MKAAIRRKYGPPEILELQEIPEPTPKKGEVLVAVEAVSLNASDWECLTGVPAYGRLWGPIRPIHRILGSDVAGRVVAVGEGVERFVPGDEVFGDLMGRFGGFAEYVCAPERMLLPKPRELTFAQAASLLQSGAIALQGLRYQRPTVAGDRVLINGAGGGAGVLTVQLAKLRGAQVTGVDRAEKLELIHSLGADQVIDFEQQDFTEMDSRYDLILDIAAHHSIFSLRRALRPKGRYAMAGGSMSCLFQALFLGLGISLTSSMKMGVLMLQPGHDDIAQLIELVGTGQVDVVIDRSYPLGRIQEALSYLGSGHARGKVVVVPTS